jgi:hypothetical protein
LSRRPSILALAASLALGSLACEKIQTPPEHQVTVPPEAIASKDAIPLEYGELVGVTPGEAVGWARLFFQRPDKSVVVVVVNSDLGIIANNVVDFPRR